MMVEALGVMLLQRVLVTADNIAIFAEVMGHTVLDVVVLDVVLSVE